MMIDAEIGKMYNELGLKLVEGDNEQLGVFKLPTNKPLLQCKYNEIFLCDDRLFIAENINGAYELIDIEGNNLLYDNELQGVYIPDIDGQIIAQDFSGKYGVITYDGDEVIPFLFDEILDYKGLYVCQDEEGKCGVINTDGDIIKIANSETEIIRFIFQYTLFNKLKELNRAE